MKNDKANPVSLCSSSDPFQLNMLMQIKTILPNYIISPAQDNKTETTRSRQLSNSFSCAKMLKPIASINQV